MAAPAAPAEISAALNAKRVAREAVLGERARKLIDIAHPKFRDVLERAGRELGYL
ncbi:MAG: hypothetical protein ACRDL1_12150 [Solirubrobacterales bacterium]